MVISSVSAGGAERVLTIMANYWAKKGWAIHLLTFSDAATPPFYELDPSIIYVPLGLARESTNSLAAAWNNLWRVCRLRSAIRATRPDCVVSFIDQVNVLTLLATRGMRIPVVVSERVYPPAHPLGTAWEWLRNLTYPRAGKVVGVTARAISHFSPRIRARARVIPNPIVRPEHRSEPRPAARLPRPSILAVGRLERQKGFDLLLRAFAECAKQHPGWTLAILGEGTLREELESTARELGLGPRVEFRGRVSNTWDYFRQADIFVLASRFEGFPMALCEAMASGVAVVATDCPSGPREVIRDGVDGLLVPNEDVPALASAMAGLMSDAELRGRLGARATEVAERFNLEKVMGMWTELLEETL